MARVLESVNAPLHIQMLRLLARRVEQRQRLHEAKCGGGLEGQDYQRHVGRIQEAKAMTQDIQDLLRRGIEDLEDLEEEVQRDEREHRAIKRRA